MTCRPVNGSNAVQTTSRPIAENHPNPLIFNDWPCNLRFRDLHGQYGKPVARRRRGTYHKAMGLGQRNVELMGNSLMFREVVSQAAGTRGTT